MAHLERSVATLRIMGDDLVPDEVTRLLGTLPTSAYARGEPLPSGVTTRKLGTWRLRAQETKPEDLDGQVLELLGQVTSDIAVWDALTTRFRVDLFCGWFMGSENEGVEIAPQTMLALGQRGIKLSLDIYGCDLPERNQVLPQT